MFQSSDLNNTALQMSRALVLDSERDDYSHVNDLVQKMEPPASFRMKSKGAIFLHRLLIPTVIFACFLVQIKGQCCLLPIHLAKVSSPH